MKETKTISRYLDTILALFFLAAGIFIDQLTKWLAYEHLRVEIDGVMRPHSIPIINGIFSLRYLENRGAAFGILQGQKPFLVILTIIILALVVILYARIPLTKRFWPMRAALVLLVAGAMGNLIDRIRQQFVIDFFFIEAINFPVFNVADIFVVVACLLLIVLLLFIYKEEEVAFLFPKSKKEGETRALEKTNVNSNDTPLSIKTNVKEENPQLQGNDKNEETNVIK